MNFHEMSNKDKIKFILLGRTNDPYFRRNYNWLSIVTEPNHLLGSLSLQMKNDTRLKNEEVLEIVKDMYCTFYHTGGYNRYHDLLRTKKCSRFQSISACTIEQFVNYKGRQVPNSDVKFFMTAKEALKEVNSH
jgi:hypothetical protein